MATSFLLRLPGVPNCPKIYWPVASASMRLYCAQLEADKQTTDSLLAAIALVEALPKDHALRPEINRNVEEWASEILGLAERKFQAGRLKDAIATVERIPNHVAAYQLVSERIAHWREIWSEAETLDQQLELELRLGEWNQAFRLAVKLTNIDNRYWATTRYERAINNIQQARNDSRQLDDAHAALGRGGLDNWLAAIEGAQQLRPQSYAYQEAQDLIAKATEAIVEQAQAYLESRQWQNLLQIAQRIPTDLDLQDPVEQWQQLAIAGINADRGTVSGLESAIALAKGISPNSSLQYKAQQLISRWQSEIEGVEQLDTARRLAEPGNISDLLAAIAEAEQVSQDNPRRQEATQAIEDWRNKIETIEDQPLLDRARSTAIANSPAALQEAISQASLITSDRALYSQAQAEIRKWQNSIQRQEDQPILTQAQSLAAGRNYRSAIEVARRIGRGRVLYPQAQGQISQWQQELQARDTLESAYQASRPNTADALARAIRLAGQVANNTNLKPESRQAVDRWSRQLLALAIETSEFSLKEAITIAANIPADAPVYRNAKAQIALWEEQLKPPLTFSDAPPLPDTGNDF
ncbi:MAG: chromosome segregation ATPase [Chloroflexaceae bacterium]|nr:chromosome segregation ATPase [Chloroflexaceae bacterium]